MAVLLLALSILPVVLLLVYIYRQDKYEKEPLKLLIFAFIGGLITIPLDLILVGLVQRIYYSPSVFYQAFIEAGLCEELCKFVILYLLIWRNKNFNEYMDGIVYAVFVSMGFACLENILYVIQGGIGTGIVRALLSVPGHFLFAVIMGYFFSMAKFSEEKRGRYLLLSLFAAALGHGLFDYLLMINNSISVLLSLFIFAIFIVGDIMLWKLGLKYIRKHQESSQFKDTNVNDPSITADEPLTQSGEPEYKKIDWDAGNKW